MADTWGGIARAMEEGVSRNEARSAREEMYPGHLEAARDANAHGIIGLLSGRHRAFVEDNKTRMRELGITPSHRNLSNELTGRYSSGDWKALQDALTGNVEIDISPITGQDTSRIGRNPDGSPLDYYGEEEQKTIDPAILSQLRREPAWIDKPSQSMGIQDRFGDRTFSPRSRTEEGIAGGRQFGPGTQMDMSGVTGYLPGRMSVGEARRARAMRNMSIRDRQEAGFGEGMYDDSQRRSRSHGMRHDRLMDEMDQGHIRSKRAHRLAQLALGNTSGTPGMGGHPSQGIGSPNWAALEEDMARRAMREDPFMGRDNR